MASESSSSDLSQTLHSITNIKIAELKKKKATYDSKKNDILEKTFKNEDGKVKAVGKLARDVFKLHLPTIDAKELSNVSRFISQAVHDSSVPVDEVDKYRDWLKQNLDHQTHRDEYATLFSAVLSEHLDQRREISANEEKNEEPSELDDSFELLKLEKDRLQQLRDKFEEVVFKPVQTDEEAIQSYLESLFANEKPLLEGMQNRLGNDTTAIFDKEDPFDDDTLTWVLKGLLRNQDLLTEDQKSLIRVFQTDELVRAELCDVLNMRWAGLESWSWTDDNSGFVVEPRRQLNGKWRIFMREDVLQAILHHYIGASLCTNAKEELKYWLREIMIPECPISQTELDEREFYLKDEEKFDNASLNARLNSDFWDDYFLSLLDDNFGYDDDETTNAGADKEKTWTDVKQQLLRHLASEVLIKSKLYGDVAVVQTDLQWYATGIPHSTIFAVLRSAGLPPKWLTWIRKYLEVPLTMDASGGGSGVRKRVRGIPMSHALEKYLGEIVLVFLDLAVKKEAGILPYRMHDDIVLCGSTAECEKGWTSMQKFVDIMGLEFNKQKTGSVFIHSDHSSPEHLKLPNGDVTMAFLKLNNKGRWIIDTEQVDAHTKQLKKQLEESTDIMSYIRTYNSCIGRFFGHTFGLPAQCFGLRHVQDILETHQRIQSELFGSGGIIAVLKSKLKELARAHTDLPEDFSVTDAFIFNPVMLGGLGVVNPFVPLLLVQDSVRDKTPEKRVDEFMKHESEMYKTRKRMFEEEDLKSKKKRRTEIFLERNSYEEEEIQVSLNDFITFDQYVKHREWTSRPLRYLYENLIKQATVREINLSSRILNEKVDLSHFTAEEKYIMQLFSDSMFHQFGSAVAIVDKALAPLGVMKAIMGHRVTWQMAL